ncbi:serine hydrolase domain-containing protein [Streptomyces sp. SCSIO ZS0520]|uniref:serine hydrolase domain-containing protein n=1 Tax=Streptomyces sp. SCSIO ZS0520 TaxID=2892996 RepID=UPI0021D9CA95|nr:serine hydrolase domain-containing protein [Streptomyces sp. SCSIO ZS0520]
MTAPRLTAERLLATARAVSAPDVVFACSQDGERRSAAAGTGRTADQERRPELRHEIGSATKTFTGLLLAHLAHRGVLGLDTPLTALLPQPPPPHGHRDAITPYTLLTHTSGLPRLPRELYRRALTRRRNPYEGYTYAQLTAAFGRSRPRRAPGSRWHYSNFGVALLAPALEHLTGRPFPELMAEQVLAPLGLPGTVLGAGSPGAAAGAPGDATGHGGDGRTVFPPFDPGAFLAAGGVRATPGELLTYLEALLEPGRCPELGEALCAVREPVLRRGRGHRQGHTLTWFSHPTPRGPLLFHSGATPGQEAFLALRPATGTALVALANRRYTRGSTLQQQAYDLFG